MYDANKNELSILEFWKKNNIFETSIVSRPENKPYVFYDGPPFATGLPHYGHILSSVIKDAIPRYKTMQGFRVRRRWGWDCHGLPIESLIEKELGLSGKKDIEEKIGVEKFNATCRAAVLKYAGEWKNMVDRIGRWVEFDTSYKTMDTSYMESVWWALKQLWNKGVIYKGLKVLQYCPRCETPVAKAETAMDHSYKDVTEEAVTIRFEIKKQKVKSKNFFDVDGPVYFLAWTTTPWTLPGNVALAVGEDVDYVVAKKLRIKNQESRSEAKVYYIVAKERVEVVFQNIPYEIVSEMKGSDLVGLEYEPLFDMPSMRDTQKKAWYVATGDFVTTDEGTGIVHTAVMYGEDDYALGQFLDLPMVPMLDAKAHYNENAPYFLQGQYYKTAEKEIKKYLTDKKLLFAKEQHTHSYPHCWRCDTALIYNAISAWFINIQTIKARLIEFNEKINWYPEHLKHGRFLNILETAPDWNISRNRYWATALPFWECGKSSQKSDKSSQPTCQAIICIGSIQELKAKAINFDEIFSSDSLKVVDLHKEHADKILLSCEICGGTMQRVSEVIDCWFEAASMPYAEFHYPFENKKIFEKRFPGQYIAEYIAQTRAWFYYLHVVGAFLFDSQTFENVVTTGTILNEKGEKLSKSKQNYPDPWKIIQTYGVDALRFYLMSSVVMQAENLFFNEREVRDIYNKVINTLTNVLEFYKQTSNFRFQTSGLQSDNVLDRWILAKLQELVKEVTFQMEHYDTVRACRPMVEFIADLSQWYVRRSRERFKYRQITNDSEFSHAVSTLQHVLLTLSKLMAPFTPFLAEIIYLEIQGKTPPQNPLLGEGTRGVSSVHLEFWPEVEPEFADAKILSDMALTRKIVEMGLSARKEAGVKVRQPLSTLSISVSGLDVYHKIIADELNVKEVRVEKDVTRLTGTWVKREDTNLSLALQVDITPLLKQEGYLREIIRAVNQMRKEADLTPDDCIKLLWKTDDTELSEVFALYATEIKKYVLADAIEAGGETKIEINGKILYLGLLKEV